MPYWDETLRKDQVLRHDLYRKLMGKSLLGFRRRIKARVGIFFVWKASKKGIRLIIDARMPNACHKKPPKTKLGGAAALAELDAALDGTDMENLAAGYGGPVELPCSLFGDTGDVSDAFYQFSVEGLAEWFGLDDPVRAGDFGVTSVWDDAIKADCPVKPDELLYPVFLGMPQGWTWALHLCNTAIEHGMSRAIPASQFVKEGMPPPDLRKGPVGSVYVDNIGVFGFVEKVVHDSFEKSIEHLERAGFLLHELERGDIEVTNVGIVLHRDEMKIKHSRKRSWRLYLALKYVLRMRSITCEALRVILGHIVHLFSLFRPGLSTLFHTYKFVYRWLDGRAHVIPGVVKRELRTVVGLIFQIEVDLALPYADKVYCGDSSSYGFCFQYTPATAEEQREHFRFHERWRFVEVEKGIGLGLGSHHSWAPDVEVPDIAYVRWLRERMALPALGSGELERGTPDLSRGNHLRKFESVELVGMVPRLPDSLVAAERWRTVIQRKWRFNEPIHMKEGRVALMSLRRETRSLAGHQHRLLTLCDNLSAVCALDRGRAKDLALLSLCRRSSALQLASGIRWHLRYIETSRNPSDEGSRRFPSKNNGHLQRAPLLSTSSTVQRPRSTASHSRGARWRQGQTENDDDVGRSRCESVPPPDSAADSARGVTSTPACSSKPAPSRTVRRDVLCHPAKTRSSLPVAPSFLELFSGSSRLTSAVDMKGLRVAVPFELKNGKQFDLTKKSVQQLILAWIRDKRFWFIHLGTPCTQFSIAKTSKSSSKMLSVAMNCVKFTARVIRLCAQHSVFFSLENPKTSKMFLVPCIRHALRDAGAFFVEFDCCRYGCTYKKSTLIATNCDILHSLGLKCNCSQRYHDQLRGRVKLKLSSGATAWFWKTTLAGEYAGPLCHKWASLLSQIAPARAFRPVKEPQFMPGWLDEICQVTHCSEPRVLRIEPCPTNCKCPWGDAIDSWGTGNHQN
eukprot:Skav230032  [mRNA]  locus=scaffold261:318609:321503:- [translate_table: standard]